MQPIFGIEHKHHTTGLIVYMFRRSLSALQNIDTRYRNKSIQLYTCATICKLCYLRLVVWPDGLSRAVMIELIFVFLDLKYVGH